nr:PREDICTED: myosin light chain kinase 3 [Latimeria chalumnae]|eukprot:XP_006012152.1 PREDICTED: myosin light chain kinase 3 [Latimeria chalumnae]
MNKAVSLTTCLAKMYEGGSVDCEGGSRASISKSPSNNLSAMDKKLNLLNEKVDKLVDFQGEVMKKLEVMHQDTGDWKKSIEKRTVAADGHKDRKDGHESCSCGPKSEIKALCIELLKLMKTVHQDSKQQSEKIDRMEKDVTTVEKAVTFMGETFKNSNIVEFILKGIVPWKKGSVLDSFERKDKSEDKFGKPKQGLSNRGVQAEVRSPEGDSKCDEDSICEKNLGKEVGKSESIKASNGRAGTIKGSDQAEVVDVPHQQLTDVSSQEVDSPDSHDSCYRQPKADTDSKKFFNVTVTRKAKDSTSRTRGLTRSRDVYKDMHHVGVNTDETRINGGHKESASDKEKEKEIKIKLKLDSEPPEGILSAITSGSAEGNTLENQRSSSTLQKVVPEEQGNLCVTEEESKPGSKIVLTNKALEGTIVETGDAQDYYEACNGKQKPASDKPTALQRTQGIGTKKPTKSAAVQPKNAVDSKKQTKEKHGQKDDDSVGFQKKLKNDLRRNSIMNTTETPKLKEPEKDSKLNDLSKAEAKAIETENGKQDKALGMQSTEEGNETSKKQDLVIIDDSPSPPAPFEHRIVRAKLEAVTTLYEINQQELLGGGRFGQVHKCVEMSTSLTLAAKIIKVKGAKDREVVKNEINIMNQLNHVNLIQLYDAYESKNNLTLIMEYVDGGELFDRIINENYTLTELDAIIFTKQICEGVNYLHQQYILHLDLKPENILCVNHTGNQIKIIDFGLARRYKPQEKLKVHFGTPEFLAPEVVNYDHVSFSTDMWSMGIITYMLLSGLSPFLGETETETMNNIVQCNWCFDAEAFEHVSEEAKDFISKLIVKEKCVRVNATQCLKHDWLNNLPEKAKKCKVRLKSQVLLQRYMAQRHWKKHFHVVAAANRLRKLHCFSLGS